MSNRKKHIGAAVLFALSLLVAIALKYTSIHHQRPTVVQPIAGTPKVEQQIAYADASEALFYGDLQAQQALATKVIKDIEQGISADTFNTGSDRYDAEWAAGSYQMAVLGLGQMIWSHPELKEDYLPVMKSCVGRLLSPEMNQFGADAWGEDGLSVLNAKQASGNRGHAYLGYTNLALSMLRVHSPNNRFASINDQLSAAFLQQITEHPYGVVETYPGEAYPADISAAIASIALHVTATQTQPSPEIETLAQQFIQQFTDAETGMIIQAVDAKTGTEIDRPRASGTALSAYYLSFTDTKIADQTFQPIRDSQQLQLPIGVAIKEYPAGESGAGDIDSGEIVMEASPSATAFAIGGARLSGNETLYRDLHQTVLLFSENPFLASALAEGDTANVIDSPLGNSILLAMLTATDSPDST